MTSLVILSNIAWKGGPSQKSVFLSCNFFTKFRVELTEPLAGRAVFFGWVEGFFLSNDFTVFAKVFSLLGFGLSSFNEDSLSLTVLSFVFWRVSS